MEQHRKPDRNITADELKETFGFSDITFGNYVTASQRQNHVNYAFDAFHDLLACEFFPLSQDHQLIQHQHPHKPLNFW